MISRPYQFLCYDLILPGLIIISRQFRIFDCLFFPAHCCSDGSSDADGDQHLHREPGAGRLHHLRLLHPLPVPGRPPPEVEPTLLHVQAMPICTGERDLTFDSLPWQDEGVKHEVGDHQ